MGVIDDFDRYVHWYSWARASLADDAIVAHTAAAAAVDALDAGDGDEAAAVAARAAAGDEAAQGLTRATYDSRHRYVDRFVWARANLGVPDERCHQAAREALESATRDRREPLTSRVLAHQFGGDALASIVLGVISVLVPILTPIYFPILPIFGLWRGVLAVRGGRVAGGVIGLAVSADGCLMSLVASGILNSVFR